MLKEILEKDNTKLIDKTINGLNKTIDDLIKKRDYKSLDILVKDLEKILKDNKEKR